MTAKQRGGSTDQGSGPLSPLIHARSRLLILSFLLRVKRAVPFTEMRKSLQMTDGALSVQISKLEAGDLISVTKSFEGRRPLTLIRVTPRGRRQFQRYVAELKEVVPGLTDD